MAHTAKLFTNGRSQAVRLPAAYRFKNCHMVYVSQDPITQAVTLSPRRDSWADFFKLVDQLDIPKDFMAHRKDLPLQDRKLFE